MGKLLRISDDDCGEVDGAGSQWSAVLGCRNGGLDRSWRSGGRVTETHGLTGVGWLVVSAVQAGSAV
jgi:hypothetical protein